MYKEIQRLADWCKIKSKHSPVYFPMTTVDFWYNQPIYVVEMLIELMDKLQIPKDLTEELA